jgi:hypothetical protein
LLKNEFSTPGVFSFVLFSRTLFKRGAFALVDAKEALGRAKRDASTSLLSAFTQKERAAISLEGAAEAEQREWRQAHNY